MLSHATCSPQSTVHIELALQEQMNEMKERIHIIRLAWRECDPRKEWSCQPPSCFAVPPDVQMPCADAPAKRSKTPLTDARAPGWQEESPAASSSTLSERLGLESAGSQSTEEGEEVSHRDGGGGREGAAVEGSLGDRLMAAAAAGRLPLDPEGSKLREDAMEVGGSSHALLDPS